MRFTMLLDVAQQRKIERVATFRQLTAISNQLKQVDRWCRICNLLYEHLAALQVGQDTPNHPRSQRSRERSLRRDIYENKALELLRF